jgi:hypothetical protein
MHKLLHTFGAAVVAVVEAMVVALGETAPAAALLLLLYKPILATSYDCLLVVVEVEAELVVALAAAPQVPVTLVVEFLTQEN